MDSTTTTPTPRPNLVSPSEVRVWDGVEAIPAAIIAAFVVGVPLRLLLPAETRFMLVSISLAVVASTIVLVMPGVITRPAMWLMKGLAGLAMPTPLAAAHGGGDRWIVAVHEASHKVAAEKKGHATAFFTNEAGTRGRTNYDIEGTAVDEAVITFAGSIGAKKITGSPGLAGSDDIAKARRLLRGTGVSESQARARADAIVSANTGKIRRYARHLDKNGRV